MRSHILGWRPAAARGSGRPRGGRGQAERRLRVGAATEGGPCGAAGSGSGWIDALPGTQVLPADGRGQVLLNREATTADHFEYRVLVQRGTGDAPTAQELRLLTGAAVTAMTIPADHPHRGTRRCLSSLQIPFQATLGSELSTKETADRTLHTE